MAARYRAAVIGVGKAGAPTADKGGGHQIGYLHTEVLGRNDEVEVTAGADIDPGNLAAWQSEFGVERGYASHREMLAEERPDLVSICTYVGLHAEMIGDCVAAGVRGIFCEKPLLASPRELGVVRQALAESDTRLIVAHHRRYHPLFKRMRELVAQGAIGRPLLVWASLPGWDLSEWGSHWLDLFRFVNSDAPLAWVMGQARVRDGRGYGHAMEEQAIAYFGLENGCKGLLDGGGDLAQPFHMIFTGSAGEIRFQGDPAGELSFSGPSLLTIAGKEEAWSETHPSEALEVELTLWDEALAELIGWIEGGPEPTVGARNALATSELNLAAYLSALRRDRIDLPLEDLSLDEWPVDALAGAADLAAAGGVGR